MACAIDSIVTLDCNDDPSGIEWIAVADVDNISTFTADSSGNVTAITTEASTYFYKIALDKEKALFEEVEANENTPFWTQTLTFATRKLTANNRRYFQLLAYNRLAVIIKTRAGQYILMGKTGAKMSAGTASTGTAFGDFNGNNITITSNEPLPYYTVASNQIQSSLIIGL